MEGVDRGELLFKHPFRMMCTGASGTGKTTFVTSFLKHIKDMVDKEMDIIVFSYSQEQPLYDKIKENNPEIVWVEGYDAGMDETYLSDNTKNKLVVFDDQMESLTNNLDFQNFFTKKSHHMNISVIFLVQNIFYKSKYMRTINLNTTVYAIFRSPRDMNQVQLLARQLYPGNTRYMIDSYKDATSQPFGYLIVDIDPRTLDKFRLRTKIFPEDTTVIYREKRS